ncbi:uncharacterized protein LOC107303452 [Oryza brachyantha]|uniref:uncharacterized protein LOC107303452 n=1 Tax=Oryza brachyantha TaxID=4533 RepID=UPI00077696DC|nr:uncharacterized protein LOC107303452 [Oryza brachyantha]
MVSKTRSQGSVEEMEEISELRAELGVIKKDIAGLKDLKTEVSEIKGLLVRFCEQKDAEVRGEVPPVIHTDTAGAGTSAAHQENVISGIVRDGGVVQDADPLGHWCHQNFQSVVLMLIHLLQHLEKTGGLALVFQEEEEYHQAIIWEDLLGFSFSMLLGYRCWMLKGMFILIHVEVICEKFYEVSGTPHDQWVNLALAHLCGRAATWFRGHGSTVNQYIDRFEECMDLVRRDHPYLQEPFLTSCFIGGLRGDIKHDVSGHRPQGLLESYWYAKNYEKAALARRKFSAGSYNRSRPPEKPNTFKVAARTEPTRDKEGKKCWYCKEPWDPKHQCKIKKVVYALLMEPTEDEEVEASEEDEKEADYKSAHGSPAKDQNQEKEELMLISHTAIYGTSRPDTFAVLINIQGKRAVGLVDSGSTGTFMDHDFAHKSGCKMVPSAAKKVTIAGGGELLSDLQVPETNYTIQQEKFCNKFNLIPLKGYDVILGADWIYQHSPIELDLKQRSLSITKCGKMMVIQDFTKPGKHWTAQGKSAGKLWRKGEVGCMIQIHLISEQSQGNSKQMSIPTEIEKLLLNFPEVVQEPKGLPPKRECDHSIHLKAGAEPPNLRPYRVPHYQKESMENIISELLQSEEIQPSLSPYASPAVMVRKKDGSWRLCVDYRQLNAQTIKNKFPMPITEDLIGELSGAVVFTKLDLRSGYHQIRMDEKDIPKTAFKTHMGHYEYRVMPFGLTNAPATFQALMNHVFAEHLRKFVIVFFDDILIYSKNMSEHLEHLNIVLQILDKQQLKIKLKKCTFAQPSVAYLGHVISSEGVATNPEKIAEILNWQEPKNVTELRSFLGMTGYYRRFIKGYGVICRPLHDMLKKDGFHWGEEQTQAFESLKTCLCHSPVLTLPNFNEPFTLETDASGKGIGAVLIQKGNPIAYFSKSLGPKAAAQSIYEKESIAILEALKHWRHYILGNQLIIRTDQQSLKYMMSQRLTEGIQHKLLLKLLEYDYTIEYKSGKENRVADALSRKPGIATDSREEC